MKNALIFVDENIIKIVVGDIVKCTKLSDIHLPQNVAFVKQLFANCKVIVLQTAAEITFQDFKESFLDQDEEAPKNIKPQEEVEEEEEIEEEEEEQPKPKPKARKPDILDEPEQEDDDIWVKSLSETTIIIDDLLTNQTITRPGVGAIRSSVSIPPGTAINLSKLDMEEVKKSSILRRLLANGTIKRSNAKEAAELRQIYEKNLKKTQFSVLDDPNDMEEEEEELPRPKKKKKQLSAAAMADSMFDGDVPETVEVTDQDSDETEEERLARTLAPETVEAKPAKRYAQGPAPSGKASMEQLLDEGAKAEEEGLIVRSTKRKFTGRLR